MSSTATATMTDAEMCDLLFAEAAAAGADPAVIRVGDWVGVCADEVWARSHGYDTSPWDATGVDGAPSAVATVAAHAGRTVVTTRSVTHHTPPIHNGAPTPPAVNSNRVVVAFTRGS